MKRTDPTIPPPETATRRPRESNCSPVNNERCCFIELSLPYWCHFMAPASVPAEARTFSPPFSRTIARIIPAKLLLNVVFRSSFFFFLFLFFVFSLRSIEDSKEFGGRRSRWKFFLMAFFFYDIYYRGIFYEYMFNYRLMILFILKIYFKLINKWMYIKIIKLHQQNVSIKLLIQNLYYVY